MTTQVIPASLRIAIVGNPNSGKSTIFNLLTGMRQKVANYPGVTVEKKEGYLRLRDGRKVTVIDLPGAYSLYPTSPDEKVTTDVLLGCQDYAPPPDLVLCVVDASNLARNLYLATEIIDREIPVILVLNMIDVARRGGKDVNATRLSEILGVRVVPTVATNGTGVDDLLGAIEEPPEAAANGSGWTLPDVVRRELEELTDLLQTHQQYAPRIAFHSAIHFLSTNNGDMGSVAEISPLVADHLRKDRELLDFLEIDRQSVFVESRYKRIKEVCRGTVSGPQDAPRSLTEHVDQIVLHRFWGYLIFAALMGTIFQSVFSWATIPMEAIAAGFDTVGRFLTAVLPEGDLRDLLVNGALAGVSAVVVFLPQILFLFFFLGLLEDTGYLARAAFLMDKVMSGVGLHGKSFIPLMSSFACAIPGIMATRTLENSKDRLATMLVAPLIGCSARLPVYTLLIAAFVPPVYLYGVASVPALALLGLYVLGLAAALGTAWIFRKTFLKGRSSTFIMELPPYRRPSFKSIMIQMWDRSKIFLQSAGTFILGVSIVLWFLASYPRLETGTPAEQLRQSFAGRAGQMIEPVIEPLGFNWKIGIGLIGSILQREVFVSTMGTIYNIENANETDGSVSLKAKLRSAVDPATGRPEFTLLTALCLMVYYAFAMQCMSTVAIMHRETNGWKWPLFQIGYMTVLAYGATFLVYRFGLMIGLGG